MSPAQTPSPTAADRCKQPDQTVAAGGARPDELETPVSRGDLVLSGPLERARRYAKWPVRVDSSRRTAWPPDLELRSKAPTQVTAARCFPSKKPGSPGLEDGPKGTISSVHLTVAPLRRFDFPDLGAVPKGTIFGVCHKVDPFGGSGSPGLETRAERLQVSYPSQGGFPRETWVTGS